MRREGWDLSESTVRRILRHANLQPHRQKMWLTSHDDEFRHKRDDVLNVYYKTCEDEHVICVDEQTGMQALERRHANIAMRPGQPVRREFEYIRHGTLCLMGALDVRRGRLFGFCSKDHNTSTFVDLLNVIDVCYPQGRGHIIMDNLFAHDTDEVNDWFDGHPSWTRHFTPKHGSWLNQIECAFSILRARVLARGSFTSTDDLCEMIYAYLTWHNQSGQPFHWTYRPSSWRNRRAWRSRGDVNVVVDAVVNADAVADAVECYGSRSLVSMATTRSRSSRARTISSPATMPSASKTSNMAAHSKADPRAMV